MRETRLRLASAALALCGAGIAAYLAYTRLTDNPIMCPTTGCASVQRSAYSTIAGVPVAYLGVLGFAAIAATVPWRRLNGWLVLGAAAFVTYLLIAQLALIHAVCTWCLGTEAVAYALLLVALLRRYPGRPDAPVPPHDVRLPDERARQRAHQGHARGARPR